MRTAAEERPPLLPDGFHEMTLDALRALCADSKRFAAIPYRTYLMDSLVALAGRLNRAKIEGEIWVDGSFLTEATDPSDVDISLNVMGDFYDAASPAKKKLMDSVELIKAAEHIDGYLVFQWPKGDLSYRLGQDNLALWRKQWRESRGGVLKGIAVVKLSRGLQ
jgi:hypothetical protein